MPTILLKSLPDLDSHTWLLEKQDAWPSSVPAHLACWVADASSVRRHASNRQSPAPHWPHWENCASNSRCAVCEQALAQIRARSPPLLQYVACVMLLDGVITVPAFHKRQIDRPQVERGFLVRVGWGTWDNLPNFNTLYCEMSVALKDGAVFTERSDTFYGHWRKPLSQKDLQEKFKANSCRALSCHAVRKAY